MKLQISLSASIRHVYKIYCFRRSSLIDIPNTGISISYLKTQDPKWIKTVSVPNEDIHEFLTQYDMPKNETFLFFVENLNKTAQRASKNAPDWRI